MELDKRNYKKTEVGYIPVDWEVNPLESYFTYISYGFTNPMPESNSGVFLITAKDVNYGEIQFKNARKTPYWAYDKLLTSKSKPKPKDILITKDGTLGRIAIVGHETICINQSVAVIRPNNKIYPLFLKKLLESPYYQKVMNDNAGGSTIKHIYITIVNKMLIGTPKEIDEQKAIATALSDVDALIDSLDKLIAKKKAIKQGAMQQLLTPPTKGGKRLPGFKEEWIFRDLSEIANIKTGSKNNQDKVSDGPYPFFVRSQTVERINTYSYDGEAILVPGEGGIGTIFHYINGKFDVHQRVYKISDFDDGVYGMFIFLKMQFEFYDHAMKNSVKATVDSLRLPTFQEFKLTIPSNKKEQIAIAEAIFDFEKEINFLEGKRAKYSGIKQGMMQELLTGKIRLV